MFGLITAFFVSFITTLAIIRFKHLHHHFSGDSDLSGPQKVHTAMVPRIGGISIAIGLFSATIIRGLNNNLNGGEVTLLLCAIPTFAIGLTEDITKKISVRVRLIFTVTSAICAIFLLNIQINNLGIPFINFIFAIPFFGVVLSVFAITGLANAYNIIDGFNGLSSMVGILTLLAIGYVAFTYNDFMIVYLCLIMIGSILGFFIWNYPQGTIFLGDGGAYLIGFWIGTLSVWLCFKHNAISPWFAVLINGYPIMETLFTIYRRKIHQGKSPGAPDGIHFHTLIYRRLLINKYLKSTLSANARTAPYLWILTGLSIAPAIFCQKSTPMLMLSSAIFILSYIWIYRKIVQFKTPTWLHLYN